LWDSGVVPFWQAFIELDSHILLEVGSVFAAFLEDLIDDSDNDFEPGLTRTLGKLG